MYLYAGSICATKTHSMGLAIESTCIIFNANNDMEALGIASTYCRKTYPQDNGYFNHLHSAMKASDIHLQNDVRVVALKKGA